ncbi:hypothetical protein C1645_757681 [Glomus cerebriforme]|uniref:ER membrane protein complex subunit 2 n=1 Tax=Glomus cerebriforme TaxID=658196 RepID=A0A397TBW6_9GLOM|nr:hypothetical protein C1645_757681 [Glomus cerebriforme]
MQSAKSKQSLDLPNEKSEEGTRNKKSKYSIYQIVNMKIFFIKRKLNNKSSKSTQSTKSAKLTQLTSEVQTNKPSLEFVLTVTDFDKEQFNKAKSYIKLSKYSEALSILEPLSKQTIQIDYEVLYWMGHCHEYLQNYELADQYYKLCADYLFDDGYWETVYGKFLLEHSNLSKEERVEKGIKRLLSAANKKRYVTAMYILGKVYLNGLYDVEQDFHKGELYLKRAYNGGEKDRAWTLFEKKAKELVSNGQLSEVPLEHIWAKS